MVATAPGRKKTPHRAPPCEELDPPYDTKLVFVQEITFVHRKWTKRTATRAAIFLTPIFTKSFVGWDSTEEAYSAPPDSLAVFRGYFYKVAPKTNWHRYGTKLRLHHPMYTAFSSGARFTKYLAIYRKIIFSLSEDRLTIMTYNVLRFLWGIS